jgi:pimeloyl-ACP methyl ester carboxylesterase
MGAMSMVAFGARHPAQLRHQVSAAMMASTAMNELVIRNRIVPLPLPLAKLARPVISRAMGMSAAGKRTNGWQRFITRYSGLSSSASEADVLFCTTLIGSCPPATRAAFARMLSRLNLDEQVGEFGVPTVVVAGTHDRLTPIWHARRLAGALPELLEFIEIPGSGHMTPVQSATEVNTALRRLVRDHLGPDPVLPGKDAGKEMQTGPANGSINISDTPGTDIPDTAQETA